MLKDYKTRVDATYKMLESTIALAGNDFPALHRAVTEADEEASRGIGQPVPLGFELADKPNAAIRFLGYKQLLEKSDISGTDRVVYTKVPYEANIPRYDSLIVTKSVQPPFAYLIPRQWREGIDRLRLHGLKVERLTAPATLDVESYRFSNAAWQQAPFEGRHPVTYSVQSGKEHRSFPAGTAVVRMNQRAARVAVHALEPEAPDAFVAWGLFDAIFEQKEYAENYVMETMARDMLAKDPQLKKEFEARLERDTSFAHSPAARLRFFYERSPYWDSEMNRYPVVRLMTNARLETEPLP